MKNKKTYTHIDRAERKEIAMLLGKGYSLRDIGKAMDRSVSSISEEIHNNSVDGQYDPKKAHHKARVRRQDSKYQGMKIVQRPKLREYVERNLREDWSPDEISGRIKEVDKHIPYVSGRSIYKYAYSSYGELLNLEDCLRYQGKPYGKGFPTEKIDGRIFIDDRPKIVDERRRFGDFEGDFIVSGKHGSGVLLVLHERKARYDLLRKLKTKNIADVHRMIRELTGGVILNSLTLDNDIVFKKHEELSRILGKPIYFCHPYHSWEKGGIEYVNKLIRQYIPKGADISRYSDEYIQEIEDKLNNRPRKCLGYKTPLEVMRENNQFKKEVENINMYIHQYT